MNLTRLETLVGEENINKLKKLKILVLGVGSVGGAVIESLVRSGIENFTLVDFDTIKPSNINNQQIVTIKNNNKYKTKEWKKRIKLINKNACVNIINTRISEKNMECLFGTKYDYIIDACDTSLMKSYIIKECLEKNIKLITTNDIDNRLDCSKIYITTLGQIKDNLSVTKLKKELGIEALNKVNVVTSSEKPINSKMLGSAFHVCAYAGLLITNKIIEEITQ